MFEKWLGKKAYQSMTMWGLAILGGVQAGEAVGLIPPGTSVAATGVAKGAVTLANAIGAALVALGIRRAATPS